MTFLFGLLFVVLAVANMALVKALGSNLEAGYDLIEAANPGQTERDARRLVRELGELIISAISWGSRILSLIVLPLTCWFIYSKSWIMLPVIILLGLIAIGIAERTKKYDEALKRYREIEGYEAYERLEKE